MTVSPPKNINQYNGYNPGKSNPNSLERRTKSLTEYFTGTIKLCYNTVITWKGEKGMSKGEANGVTNAAGVAYGELIRRQRKAKNMKQEELGALVRVGKNAVGAWEAGRSRPDVSSVPIICEALDLSLNEFFGIPASASEDEAELSAAERMTLIQRYSALNGYNRQVIQRQMTLLREMQEESVRPRKVIRLFMNELAASAGPGETLEAARGEEVFLFADALSEAADEIIRVNGNSMEPTYLDGDLVFVRHTPELAPGEIGIFILGDTGYIKEYREDGLHSHNPAYATITIHEGDDVRCAGKVLGRVRRESWAGEEDYDAWKRSERKDERYAETSAQKYGKKKSDYPLHD
jgi:SOS-response transcriptional repressors (RecA-mediated autopeptidases)